MVAPRSRADIVPRSGAPPRRAGCRSRTARPRSTVHAGPALGRRRARPPRRAGRSDARARASVRCGRYGRCSGAIPSVAVRVRDHARQRGQLVSTLVHARPQHGRRTRLRERAPTAEAAAGTARTPRTAHAQRIDDRVRVVDPTEELQRHVPLRARRPAHTTRARRREHRRSHRFDARRAPPAAAPRRRTRAAARSRPNSHGRASRRIRSRLSRPMVENWRIRSRSPGIFMCTASGS